MTSQEKNVLIALLALSGIGVQKRYWATILAIDGNWPIMSIEGP